jgi:hypothetical protein
LYKQFLDDLGPDATVEEKAIAWKRADSWRRDGSAALEASQDVRRGINALSNAGNTIYTVAKDAAIEKYNSKDNKSEWVNIHGAGGIKIPQVKIKKKPEAPDPSDIASPWDI